MARAVPLENSAYSTHQKLLCREVGLRGCGEGVEDLWNGEPLQRMIHSGRKDGPLEAPSHEREQDCGFHLAPLLARVLTVHPLLESRRS